MNITFKTQPAPTIPRHIREALLEMSPRHFLVWNPRWEKQKTSAGKTIHDGRWEIWIELRETSHPDASNELADTDRWNSEHRCWMRRLQAYTEADGSFAPIDDRLLVGLQLADAWADRRFFEDNIEIPHRQRQQAVKKILRQGVSDATRYYHGLDNPIVGPHTSGDWRHRYR